jgi:hypothetical protein
VATAAGSASWSTKNTKFSVSPGLYRQPAGMTGFFALLGAFMVAMMILPPLTPTTDDDPWGFQ